MDVNIFRVDVPETDKVGWRALLQWMSSTLRLHTVTVGRLRQGPSCVAATLRSHPEEATEYAGCWRLSGNVQRGLEKLAEACFGESLGPTEWPSDEHRFVRHIDCRHSSLSTCAWV